MLENILRGIDGMEYIPVLETGFYEFESRIPYLVFTHSHKTLNFWELTLGDCPLVPHSSSIGTQQDATNRRRFKVGLAVPLLRSKNLQSMDASSICVLAREIC